MSIRRATTSPPDELPAKVESPRGKLVYLYLAASGGATIHELQDALDLPKLSLYSVLRTLRERGLVTCSGEQYRPAADAG